MIAAAQQLSRLQQGCVTWTESDFNCHRLLFRLTAARILLVGFGKLAAEASVFGRTGQQQQQQQQQYQD
jgi:hypothetical protein